MTRIIIENGEYDCNTCLNRDTDVCLRCSTTVAPSGSKSKPTGYQPSEIIIDREYDIETREEWYGKGRLIALWSLTGNTIPIAWVNEYNKAILEARERQNIEQ